MPPTRHVAKEQPVPAATTPNTFNIPSNSHLLITTPSFIFAWHSAGLHTIFRSSKSGIVAAREAKDGSGMLAVADKRVVVLHDTRRGTDQSWGLNGDDDEVRQLEYGHDARYLYLSTSLTNEIQRYSTVRSKLMSPAQAHNSAPTALAVSPTGHLMLSASDKPPTVYLKSLQHNSNPTLIEPQASAGAVCAAAFHPERPNIFMLGFRDGTLAAYDATRVSRKHQGSVSDQGVVHDGEVAHFTSLHRTTSKTVTRGGISSKTASIAGAAFLQGYKTRAISIGSDGRCRLVDFADGGIILRSWHAKAPLTSVSVLSIKSPANTARSTRRQDTHTLGGPTSTNNLIAVSRADGKVHIYDSVGILLGQKTISEQGEKVISVEWVKGPSPQQVSGGPRELNMSDAPTILLPSTGPVTSPPSKAAVTPMQPKTQRRQTPRGGLGLPPGLRRPLTSTQKQSARPNRRFTIHPDEVEEGTVRRTSSPTHAAAVPVQANNYMDLFSPVKPSQPERPEKRLTSPRARPRISSQTFNSPTKATSKPLPPPPDSHATSTGSETARPAPLKTTKTAYARRVSTHNSPLKKRPIGQRPQRQGVQQGSILEAPALPPNENAKVLADLRKMSKAAPGVQQGSVLAPFASSKVSKPNIAPQLQPQQAVPVPKHHSWPTKQGRQGVGKQKAWHPGNVLEREATWPTDSVLDESEEDIWITDHSDKERNELQRRRLAPLLRPPGRQTSRSRVDSKGTFGTADRGVSPRGTTGMAMRNLDGSTTDEPFGTARSHFSPEAVFSPASEDIRQLFPRASSLSPKRKRSPKRLQHSPNPHGRALQELAGNTIGRQAKSPWAKAKAAKTQSPKDFGGENAGTAGMVRSPTMRCVTCTETSARVSGLEDEVARLRGELLALKAALRQNGVALPASIRGLR